MSAILFRASSIGRLMPEPKTKKEGILSVGARTFIRSLVAQDIFGINFEISSRPMEKGILCEQEGIELVNRVRGLSLAKNTKRIRDDFITGECDLWDEPRREGRDIKCAWSAATFPILPDDAFDREYEWQMRAYMRLWDAPRWHVDYVLISTPPHLIGFEPIAMHFFDHLPEAHRVTTWTVERDAELEARMIEKVSAAREYYAQVVAEFDATHPYATEDAGEPHAAS